MTTQETKDAVNANDIIMEVSAGLERLKGMLIVLSASMAEEHDKPDPMYVGLSYDLLTEYVEILENRLDTIDYIRTESKDG